MVKYYVTLEIYGERACLQKLEEFCKERDLVFEISERFDGDSYKECREEAKNELGFEDIFKGYITFKNTRNCKQIIAEIDQREDINICIKIDL